MRVIQKKNYIMIINNKCLLIVIALFVINNMLKVHFPITEDNKKMKVYVLNGIVLFNFSADENDNLMSFKYCFPTIV